MALGNDGSPPRRCAPARTLSAPTRAAGGGGGGGEGGGGSNGEGRGRGRGRGRGGAGRGGTCVSSATTAAISSRPLATASRSRRSPCSLNPAAPAAPPRVTPPARPFVRGGGRRGGAGRRGVGGRRGAGRGGRTAGVGVNRGSVQ